MGLDIRIPLGLLFLFTGGIMSIYGFLTRGSDLYQKSLGINLNLTWGAFMFLFGAAMLIAGRRQRPQDGPATPHPQEHDRKRGH